MVAMAENSPAGSKRARSRTSPTGLTPRQASKKTYGSMIRQEKRLPGKKLPFGPVRSVPLTSCSQSWTKAEELGLVRFLITRGYSTAWPTTKRLQFWSDAADYLLKYHGHSVRTSEFKKVASHSLPLVVNKESLIVPVGGNCRARVMMKLATKYKSPSVAENQLNATGSDVVESSAVLSDEASTTLPRSSYSPLTIEHLPCTPTTLKSPVAISVSDPLFERVTCLSSEEQTKFVVDLISHVALHQYGVDIPDDFLTLALRGMQRLESVGKSNIIYGLCKGLGTIRPDGSDSYFPMSRMPFGLLHYMIEFFITDPGHEVCCLVC